MRLVLLITLFVAGLLLFGCLAPSTPSAPVENNSPVVTPPVNHSTIAAPPPAPCANTNTVSSNDACFKNLAASESNISWCGHIFSTAARDDCLFHFVPSDPALCEQMINSSNQQACFGQVARQLNSSDYCARLADNASKTQCYVDIRQPCALMTTNDSMGRCLANVNSDFTLCRSDSCLFDYALNRSDTHACELITGERASLMACRAAVKNDPSACLADNVSSRSDLCYEQVALAKNDSSWCNYGQSESPYRNDCYLKFAIARSDSTLCAKASPESSRDVCYVNYSMALDAPAVCPLVVNSIDRTRCYVFTARANGDPSACNGLALDADQSSCYNTVINGDVPIKNLASCAGMTDTKLWGPRCFITLAVQLHDISVCDHIADASSQATCRAKLS